MGECNIQLHPYNTQGQFEGALKPVSAKNIDPAMVICPASMEYQTKACKKRALVQDTRDHDLP
jgi:hypothetical protein